MITDLTQGKIINHNKNVTETVIPNTAKDKPNANNKKNPHPRLFNTAIPVAQSSAKACSRVNSYPVTTVSTI